MSEINPRQHPQQAEIAPEEHSKQLLAQLQDMPDHLSEATSSTKRSALPGHVQTAVQVVELVAQVASLVVGLQPESKAAGFLQQLLNLRREALELVKTRSDGA